MLGFAAKASRRRSRGEHGTLHEMRGCSCGQCGLLRFMRRAAGGRIEPGSKARGAAAQSGMAENVAGLLCYVLGWITGLIFYFVDKRPFVRFHAAQSIVVFGGLHIITFVLAGIFGMSSLMGGFGAFSWRRLVLDRGARRLRSLDTADDQGVSGREIPRAGRGRSRRQDFRQSVGSSRKLLVAASDCASLCLKRSLRRTRTPEPALAFDQRAA